MSPSLERAGVVADVDPGVKSLRGRPVTGHRTIAAISGAELDMLLIKPSWWARVDAGPRT